MCSIRHGNIFISCLNFDVFNTDVTFFPLFHLLPRFSLCVMNLLLVHNYTDAVRWHTKYRSLVNIMLTHWERENEECEACEQFAWCRHCKAFCAFVQFPVVWSIVSVAKTSEHRKLHHHMQCIKTCWVKLVFVQTPLNFLFLTVFSQKMAHIAGLMLSFDHCIYFRCAYCDMKVRSNLGQVTENPRQYLSSFSIQIDGKLSPNVMCHVLYVHHDLFPKAEFSSKR